MGALKVKFDSRIKGEEPRNQLFHDNYFFIKPYSELMKIQSIGSLNL